MTGKPGSRISIFERFYAGLEYELVDLVYSDTPLRARVPDWPLNLPTFRCRSRTSIQRPATKSSSPAA